MPKRALSGIAVMAAVALLTAACGTTTNNPATTAKIAKGNLKGVKFAFAMPTSQGQVYVAQQKTFTTQAQALGAKVTVYDNHGDADTMLRNADLMVAARPDVIVEYPSVANATDRVGQKFKTAGIPCIAINVPVKGCSFFNFDQVALAKLGAQAMAKKMAARGWDGTNTTVLIGQASQLGSSVNIAVTSFYDELSRIVPNMKHVSSSAITSTTTQITADQGYQGDLGLTADSGYTATLHSLQSMPQKRNLVVYTVSDDTTQGVLRAADTQGRTAKTLLSGYGGTLQGLNAVREGGVWATDQNGFFPQWGEFLLAMSVAIAQGVEPPALTSPPQVVLTKENVDTYYKPGTEELIKMPALPKASRYLLDTGILQKFGNVEGAE
ncbi:sugar ABC transporter substrate-binding protein [Streptomyces sp. R39]|uniref:Sugar ABC transporter substrate-binding protein n=1 Tax=Streptomyces sp. R39 TaxID=3238631 RepID=A0AB39QZJ8_9ACTN